jgi:peptide/nickel transport system permease protein
VRSYFAGRLAQALVIVALVATITFVLIHLAPGDPFMTVYENPNVDSAVRERLRAAYGFDRPLIEQYVRYVAGVARGELGYSFSQHRPVLDVLASTIPNTLLLMGVAVALSFVGGIALGVVQAVRRGSFADRVLGALSLFFLSMPDFWLAVMALLTFAYWIPIFPITGTLDSLTYDYMTPLERVVDRAYHVALPALTLALLDAAAIARHQRGAMLDTLHEDFVRTARAKGVAERTVVLRHVLRNALLPMVTIFGLSFPALLGGAVFVEKVFAWPGFGLMTVTAIAARDYPLVTGSVIVGSIMACAGSLLADVLYAAADPRVRAR